MTPDTATPAAPVALPDHPRQRGLSAILLAMNPDADQVHRHLWLIALLEWIRGAGSAPENAPARMEIFLDVVEARPDVAVRLQVWWRTLIDSVDGTTLLSDYGFASRNAFVSELVERLHYKLLPVSPETSDASELFTLVMPSARDSQWLAALSSSSLERLGRLLTAPATGHHVQAYPTLSYWQNTLLEAINFCTSQIRAAGFSPEIRLRMSAPALESSPFHTLSADFDSLRDDVIHWTGWWKNRISRTLLVFVFCNFGMILGEWIAGFRIVKSLL